MSLVLKDRDYVPDGNGGVACVQGGEEALGEVLFRLTARRGSFPFLPEVGSRMHLLRRARPSEWDALARQYAAEALAGLEDAAVLGASAAQERDGLWVTVDLLWQGRGLSVTARLEE